VWRATFAALHGRQFIGRLRLPAMANMIAFAGLVLVGWLFLTPPFVAAFAGDWWLLDGLRAGNEAAGPGLWLAVTWLVLGPALLDALVGALHEPLLDAAEHTLFGPPRGAPDPTGFVLRLRDRARLMLVLLAVWPLALLLVLVPWIGLPLTAVLGAAAAAAVWFEPVMAHRGLLLPARLRLLWRNRWRALGVGAGLQFAAAVPFLNLFGLGTVAAVATAVAYVQFEK
jgi:hypothetical protein